MFKRNELKAELARKNMTEADFARAIGIKLSTLMAKYKRDGDFSRSELVRIGKVLGKDAVWRIFFAEETA